MSNHVIKTDAKLKTRRKNTMKIVWGSIAAVAVISVPIISYESGNTKRQLAKQYEKDRQGYLSTRPLVPAETVFTVTTTTDFGRLATPNIRTQTVTAAEMGGCYLSPPKTKGELREISLGTNTDWRSRGSTVVVSCPNYKG